MASYIRDSCEREKIIYAKRNKFVWKVMSLFGSQLMGAQLFRRVWLRVLVPDKLHNAIIIFLRFSNAPVLSKHSDDYELSRDELSDKELSDGKMTPGYRSAPETRFLAYCFLVYFCSAREKGQSGRPPSLCIVLNKTLISLRSAANVLHHHVGLRCQLPSRYAMDYSVGFDQWSSWEKRTPQLLVKSTKI
jgi:hypothetical protein